jgi:hypothetical protein
MKRYILLLMGLIFSLSEINAQTSNRIIGKDTDTTINAEASLIEQVDPIATDRPDQTESPYLVPRGMFQIETGIWMENDRNEGRRIKNKAYNTTLFKIGVSDQFELRLISEYLGSKEYQRDSLIRNIHGINSVAIGTKIFISKERGIIPKTSLIAHLQLPYIGYKEFRPAHLAPRFRFVMQNTISDRISVAYNIGAEWDGDSQSATAIYTISCAISLADGLGMFVEGYGFMTENSNEENKFDGTFSNDHRLDAGFTYQVQKNLQVDISGGIGLSANSPDNFLSAGISWRFPH